MCLTTHYRDPLMFTTENMQAAKNSYQKLKNIISELRDDGEENEKYLKEFQKAIEDDLNIPQALAVLWKLLRDRKAKGKLQTIKKMDEVSGLKLLEKEEIFIPKEVEKLAEQREQARKKKDWKLADALRSKIRELGFSIADTEKGYKLGKI